jgi:hypothetical protein
MGPTAAEAKSLYFASSRRRQLIAPPGGTTADGVVVPEGVAEQPDGDRREAR